jgi:hypothetical protein
MWLVEHPQKAPLVAPCVGGFDIWQHITQGSPPPATVSSEPDFSFLENPGERRAAYGRLATAVKNSENATVVAVYEKLKTSPSDRDSKMKQFLTDWLIDPSFGAALLKNSTIIEQIDQSRNKEEVVSYSRLELLEGVKGAKELKDKLEKTTDQWGRECFKYSRSIQLEYDDQPHADRHKTVACTTTPKRQVSCWRGLPSPRFVYLSAWV